MNDDITTAVKVLAALGGITLLVWICVVMVKAAKRGGGGLHGVAAAILMNGWTSMRDPRNDTVAEAKDGRIRKGTNTGEPLDRDPPQT